MEHCILCSTLVNVSATKDAAKYTHAVHRKAVCVNYDGGDDRQRYFCRTRASARVWISPPKLRIVRVEARDRRFEHGIAKMDVGKHSSRDNLVWLES